MRIAQQINLIQLLEARGIQAEFVWLQNHEIAVPIGPERLVAKDLRRRSAVKGVSLSIRKGEVLGLTGLVGAGRTEVARLIFGADRRDAGTIERMLIGGSSIFARTTDGGAGF